MGPVVEQVGGYKRARVRVLGLEISSGQLTVTMCNYSNTRARAKTLLRPGWFRGLRRSRWVVQACWGWVLGLGILSAWAVGPRRPAQWGHTLSDGSGHCNGSAYVYMKSRLPGLVSLVSEVTRAEGRGCAG